MFIEYNGNKSQDEYLFIIKRCRKQGHKDFLLERVKKSRPREKKARSEKRRRKRKETSEKKGTFFILFAILLLSVETVSMLCGVGLSASQTNIIAQYQFSMVICKMSPFNFNEVHAVY